MDELPRASARSARETSFSLPFFKLGNSTSKIDSRLRSRSGHVHHSAYRLSTQS